MLDHANQHVSEGDVASTTQDVREAIIAAHPTNPALQRLQSRVMESTEAGVMITSYDRMHHRHNRS